MKTKLLPFLAIAACALTALPLRSEFTAAKAFVTAPQTVLPLLDSTTRLDMLDYHASGMEVKSTNVLRGKSGVKRLSPEAIEIDMTEVSDYLIAVLPPKSGTDTLVAVITTMDVPERDSRLDIYSSDWSRALTDRVFRAPAVRDWLTPIGKSHADQVTEMVPFMLVAYSYDPSTRLLTLTNNTGKSLSSEDSAAVSPYLRDKLQYEWNGRRFEPRP